MSEDKSISEVFECSGIKYRLTLKKTARGFYRAYAEVKFPTHMELIDFSECMPDLWGANKKVIAVRAGSTYASNPAQLAHQYLAGLIEARNEQIKLLESWGSGVEFSESDGQKIKILNEAIAASKGDR